MVRNESVSHSSAYRCPIFPTPSFEESLTSSLTIVLVHWRGRARDRSALLPVHSLNDQKIRIETGSPMQVAGTNYYLSCHWLESGVTIKVCGCLLNHEEMLNFTTWLFCFLIWSYSFCLHFVNRILIFLLVLYWGF